MSLLINRNYTSTKTGPGRVHKQGTKKPGKQKAPSAGFGFVQHTNPERAKRRRLIAMEGGIRRFKRASCERYWNEIPF